MKSQGKIHETHSFYIFINYNEIQKKTLESNKRGTWIEWGKKGAMGTEKWKGWLPFSSAQPRGRERKGEERIERARGTSGQQGRVKETRGLFY